LQETTVRDFVESLAEIKQYGIDLRPVIQSWMDSCSLYLYLYLYLYLRRWYLYLYLKFEYLIQLYAIYIGLLLCFMHTSMLRNS